MRSYEERAKDFIHKVFPFIKDVERPWDTRNNIAYFNMNFHRNVKVAAGISRIALITSDYVVKFDYDEDNVEYVGGCEAEVNLYKLAEEEGFAYMFAKITRYEYCGKAFYIMPRIRYINSHRWYYAQHFMSPTERKWCDSHHITDLHANNYGFRDGHVCLIDYACSDTNRTY